MRKADRAAAAVTGRPEEAIAIAMTTAVTVVTAIARITETEIAAIGEMTIDWAVILTAPTREETEETGIVIGMTEEVEARTLMTRRGEMTAEAMTEDIAEAAMRIVVVIVIAAVIVAATVIPDIVAVTNAVCKCILMAGISLILSLVVGRVWIKGSETYHSLLHTIRKAQVAYAHEFIVMPVLTIV